MTICGNRPETPGFFTPCRPCPCGDEVREELRQAIEPRRLGDPTPGPPPVVRRLSDPPPDPSNTRAPEDRP